MANKHRDLLMFLAMVLKLPLLEVVVDSINIRIHKSQASSAPYLADKVIIKIHR